MVEDSNSSRLERIEIKLDQLAEAMVSLARAEEKILSIQKENAKTYERVNKLSEKIDDLTIKVEDNNRTINVIYKIFWVVISALVASVAANLWM